MPDDNNLVSLLARIVILLRKAGEKDAVKMKNLNLWKEKLSDVCVYDC